MTKEQRLQVCLRQWDTATRLLRVPFTSEAYEKMSAYLLGRDALEEAPEMASSVHALDQSFAQALAASRGQWQRELKDLSVRAEFAAAAWWRRILRMAAEEGARVQGQGTTPTKVRIRPAR